MLNVLCLESYWSEWSNDRRSTQPLLATLEAYSDEVSADHRHVDSVRDIERWVTPAVLREFDMLMIAMHGDSGRLVDEDDRPMTLGRLARAVGRWPGGLVYLAGCETLASPVAAEAFVKQTKVAALVGYQQSPDCLKAAQMDFVVLGALVANVPGATGAWSQPPGETLAEVKEEVAGLAAELGWNFVAGTTAAKARRAPDGSEKIADALIAIARDPTVEDFGWRTRALLALGQFGDPAHYGRLSGIVRARSEPIEVREAAVRALRALDEAAATARLRPLLEKLPRDADGRRL